MLPFSPTKMYFQDFRIEDKDIGKTLRDYGFQANQKTIVYLDTYKVKAYRER